MILSDERPDLLNAADAAYLMSMQRSDSQVFENVISRIYTSLIGTGDTC